MTVTAGSNKVILQGDGATGPPGSPFSLGTSFIGVNAQYISVIYTDAVGNETVLSPSQYTLVLTAGQPPNWGRGGTVVYPLTGPAIAIGTWLTIVRTLPLAQAITLQNQSSYGQYAQSSETAMDLLDLQIQQIATTFSRALVAPPTDPDVNLVIPNYINRALQLLGFDGAGLPIAAQPSSALVSTAMQPVVAASTLAAARAAMGIDISTLLPVGLVGDWFGLGSPPSLWVYAKGDLVSRVTLVDLFNVLAPSLAAVVSNTSNSVTGIADTTGWAIGWALEGTGVPNGTTISAITGPTSISMSNPANANGTAIRVFPYGNGDGLNTFQLPNLNGRVTAGLDTAGTTLAGGTKIGVILGDDTHTLLVTEMPSHDHDYAQVAHDHPVAGGTLGGTNPSGSDTLGGHSPAFGATIDVQPVEANITFSAEGGGLPHNNVQPTFISRKIIYAGANP